MAYEYEIEQKDNYLLLVASGSFESVDELVAVSRAVRKKVSQLDCRRVLVDERAVVKDFEPYELVEFAEAKVDEPIRIKMAVVYTPENLIKLRWMETFFQNRSLSYRQFSSLEEAKRWLLTGCL